MIIKKKYANIKRFSDELEAVQEKNKAESKEEIKQEVSPDAGLPPEAGNEKPKQEEEKKEPKKKNTDFDFSLDSINFDQRQERREGSRRRGYRRTQDRNIISRAQSEAVAIRETAKNEGYKDGIDKAAKDIADVKSKFTEFFKYKEVVYEKVSDCVLDIAVEIAKKIIKKEVETDKETIIPIIKAALEEVNPTENAITLKVMPKDVQIVKDKVPEIFQDDFIEAKISVLPDKNIKEGGVIVETSNGIVDAQISTQMSILEKALGTQKEDSQ